MTTTNPTNYLKRITAILMALILAVTLTPIVPTAPKAHAATNLVPASVASKVTTQAVTAAKAKTKLVAKNVTASTLTYTGKALTPKVTVKVGKKTLKAGRDYTLAIKTAKGKKVSKPKAVGTYKAVVKGKGSYKGTVTKSFKVAREIMYFTTTTANNKRKKNSISYSAKYKDTSNTSGVLSFKGTIYEIPRSWVKFEIYKGRFGSLAHATESNKIGDSRYRSKMKKTKRKSFTITTKTQCYETGGQGHWLKNPSNKYNYRLAGQEVANSKGTAETIRYPVIIVMRNGKITKLAVDCHKSYWSNGF